MSKPKYKVGDMVYSYLNPTVKRRVSHIHENEAGYPNKYKLSLRDKDGYSYSSHWIDEQSLSKRKKR